MHKYLSIENVLPAFRGQINGIHQSTANVPLNRLGTKTAYRETQFSGTELFTTPPACV